MSISKLNFDIGSANNELHQRFTVDTEGTREQARYHCKDLDSRFSDHLSDRQIDVRLESYWRFFLAKNKAVELQRQFRPVSILDMKLLWLRKWCPIGVNLVSMDRGHIGLHYDRRDLKSSGVALLEPSRSIRRFLKFLQNPWQRDVWTSDAALVGGGSETSGLATQIVWGVGAETFAFDAALEGGGTETDCTSDAAYASCLFMLDLNFHSGSSITQMRLTSRSDCYRAGALGSYCNGGMVICKLVGIAFGLGCDNLCCVILELHLVCFPVFGSVDHFRDVSVWTADIETLGAIYIDCGVPVMLGGPIGSETR
ncbi:hypothetical protein F2Q69_00022239 [Brassica cretica]|uniref:Uncharacterized protein n=1 Tax=Brassica cretica TaxID=69181 RepID=A0A8S9QAM4_BRACR|nr:hypothetical protein F2Q69_00022239 [Brassica cretica]